MSATAAERVAAGAAFLDERCPGWRLRIDVERLTLTSPYNCILGQLYGTYIQGVVALDIDGDSQAAAFGFICDMSGEADKDGWPGCVCRDLDMVWLAELAREPVAS